MSCANPSHTCTHTHVRTYTCTHARTHIHGYFQGDGPAYQGVSYTRLVPKSATNTPLQGGSSDMLHKISKETQIIFRTKDTYPPSSFLPRNHLYEFHHFHQLNDSMLVNVRVKTRLSSGKSAAFQLDGCMHAYVCVHGCMHACVHALVRTCVHTCRNVCVCVVSVCVSVRWSRQCPSRGGVSRTMSKIPCPGQCLSLSEIPCPGQCLSCKNLLSGGGGILGNVRDTLTRTMSEIPYPGQCLSCKNLLSRKGGGGVSRTMSEIP